MKQLLKQYFVLCISVLFLLSAAQTVSADVGGICAEGVDKFSHTYSLTGNGPADMVAIAVAQKGRGGESLGYHTSWGGWCAAFINDCAYLASQSSAIPFRSGATHDVGQLRQYILNSGGSVVSSPQMGDIVFYHNGTRYSHVGLMMDSSNTIQGNVNNVVYQMTSPWKLDGTYTVSYVRPAYVNHVNRDPRGYLEGAEGGYGTIRVWGWAIDDDTPNQPVTVHIYADGPAGEGRCIYTKIAANNSSPDIGGNHRFDVTFETDLTGQHTIYAHAINTQEGANPLMSFIGSQPFTVNILKDETPPVISNVEINDVSWQGYTVTCDVSDDTALDRVEFATRALNTEQGGSSTAWETQEKGTLSNGKATYRVNTSAHDGKMGCDYLTNIYAYDKSGNVAVMNENTCPIENDCPILKVHVPGFEESATGDWQETDEIPADFDTSRVEVQYLHTYTKTAPSSPGEGWVQSGEGTTTYVNDGGVYESDFEKTASATCVYVGSYYYHYCGASTGVNVEHYNDGVHTDYHVAGDVNQFYVSDGPWTDDNDPRYLAYKIKWVGGQWANGDATCAADRSAIWYRRYQYQNKKAVTNYNWVKTSDWESVNDSSATSVEYRYRLIDSSDPSILFASVTAVTPADYTVTCQVSDDSGIKKVQFCSWTDSGSEADAVLTEVIPAQNEKETSVSARIPISSHGNEKDTWYHTKITVFDAAGNTAVYADDSNTTVYIPTLIRAPSRRLVLPSGLTEICESAFEDSIAFSEAILPGGVKKIGSKAFAGCARLYVVYMPDSIENIADDAFSGCSDIVLLCESDNTAAAYAARNRIPYFTGGYTL